MKLYDNHHAPNPRRVRIFLAEKAVEIPTVQVDLLKRERKSAEFRRRNSLGGFRCSSSTTPERAREGDGAALVAARRADGAARSFR